MPPRVLVAGVSTRAAAESAARAGFGVTSIDAYADLDQHPSVRALSVPREGGRFSPHAAARAAREIACDAVAYLSNFENHPRAVAALAAGRALWGNAPDTLRRVRDPRILAAELGKRGFAVPALRTSNGANDSSESTDWVVKPFRSGGGQRVRPWRPGERIPRGCYLQARVPGVPASVVFVAAQGQSVPLAMSRQLIGERAFGATGYRYCGSVLSAVDDPRLPDEPLRGRAVALAQAAVEAFGLVGVNSLDFVAAGGVPHALEINPRWSASMELVERGYGLSVFGAHAAACARGELPAFDLACAPRADAALGKAIVFARHDVTVGDTAPWLQDSNMRDVPHPGTRIAAGQPICTVFATAESGDACVGALIERAERVYAEVESER